MTLSSIGFTDRDKESKNATKRYANIICLFNLLNLELKSPPNISIFFPYGLMFLGIALSWNYVYNIEILCQLFY